jgi:hypothetical protein
MYEEGSYIGEGGRAGLGLGRVTWVRVAWEMIGGILGSKERTSLERRCNCCVRFAAKILTALADLSLS